jgi:dephospho-CoA kinase
MLKIGVTGGIGSGKSTVCRIFKNLGVPVFTSDTVGKVLMDSDSQLKQQIMAEFGKDMYDSSGNLDRQRMANLIFNDNEAMQDLSDMVHPKVKKAFIAWCGQHEKKPYIIQEAAILFESGHYHDMDKIITVFCSQEERIRRVMERDNTNRELVLKRMRFQYSDEERNKLADFIIINEGDEDLLPQVMGLHEIFLNENQNVKTIFR